MKHNYRGEQERIYARMQDLRLNVVFGMSTDGPSLRTLNSRFRAALKYTELARKMADSICAQRREARK